MLDLTQLRLLGDVVPWVRIKALRKNYVLIMYINLLILHVVCPIYIQKQEKKEGVSD